MSKGLMLLASGEMFSAQKLVFAAQSPEFESHFTMVSKVFKTLLLKIKSFPSSLQCSTHL
ncbi:hypothetical protein S83_019926 [Arachis hypogaea]